MFCVTVNEDVATCRNLVGEVPVLMGCVADLRHSTR